MPSSPAKDEGTDVAKARSLGQPYVLANVRADGRIRGSTWLRILRHPDHSTPQARPTCRHARGFRWRLVISAGVVMALTWRADAMLAHRRRTDLPHQTMILPRPPQCQLGYGFPAARRALKCRATPVSTRSRYPYRRRAGRVPPPRARLLLLRPPEQAAGLRSRTGSGRVATCIPLRCSGRSL